MSSESNVIKKLKDIFLSENCVVEKIESQFNSGKPDLYIGGHGFNMWIEAKYVESLPIKGTSNMLKHGFSPIQKAKALEMVNKGVPVFGVIGIGSGEKNMKLYVIEVLDWEEKISKDRFLEVSDVFDKKHLIEMCLKRMLC